MSTPSTEEAPARFASRNSDIADMTAIQEFIDNGFVSSVLNVMRSGKEATVYRCAPGPELDVPFAACKVYHAGEFRNFANDAVYMEGRKIGSGQDTRAVENRSKVGRVIQRSLWVNHEFDVLSQLCYAGADVPEVYAATDDAILMQYIGDDDEAAPQLQHADIDPAAARDLFERLLWNIELWLGENVVHADLSAFNVLAWEGRLIAIDFPQAVDPRTNTNAKRLLERDVRNICRYFARHGGNPDADGIAAELWSRWKVGDLG